MHLAFNSIILHVVFTVFLFVDLFFFALSRVFSNSAAQFRLFHMSQIFDFSGSVDFCRGGSLYSNQKESSHFLSLGNCSDIYLPKLKRSRVSTPFVFTEEKIQQKQPSISVLPDECLFEIFRRVEEGQDRCTCACVSKHWLMLLSTINKEETCTTKSARSSKPDVNLVSEKKVESTESSKKAEVVEFEVADEENEDGGYLSRCLEGKKATDVRLAAISIGTNSRGGLGKLSIRGSKSVRGLSNFGLKAIAHGCPTLRVLSMWNISSIGDEGLVEIATWCHSLEKLDLSQCPKITDKGLLAIAKGCPNLVAVTFESCPNIGNETLQALGRFCPNLKSISIKNCPLVGDQGITSLFSSAGCALKNVKLQMLNITDVSLAVVGHYGKSVTDLSFVGLQNVSERGFWVMGNCQGLQSLRSFSVSACQGVTDLGIEAVGKGCPNLKQLCVRKCAFLSDNGLVSFGKASTSIENLQLEECHRITQFGFFGVLINCAEKLKILSLTNCLGIRDAPINFPFKSICKSLHSLSVNNCPGFGNNSLAIVGTLCPQLHSVVLSGLSSITDEGLTPLIHNSKDGLSEVNLSGCVNLTDKVVSTIAKCHGWTLEELNVDGCKNITDATLVAVAQNCSRIRELDVSKCAVSDKGIAALACVGSIHLQMLSLSGAPLVTAKSLPFLCKLGETLVGLNIQHCLALSNGTIDFLLEKLWRCDILY